MILTHDGEMFWNEFIILPECQDLEGGHRDLRSDITALAGIFFTCLTGRPPMVLRDAQELSPHQRHEQLLLDSTETVEQGEHLIWFFNRAFAYRISDRFQTLDEFTGELTRYSDSAILPDLDLDEQFIILDKTIQSTDRNVQIVALEEKYMQILQSAQNQMQKDLKTLQEHEGKLAIQNIRIDKIQEPNRPNVKDGDILGKGNACAFILGRANYQHVAVVLLSAFGVGMQIHLYSTSYFAPSHKPTISEQPLTWSKIAVFDETTKVTSESKQSVIVNALKTKLAHEIRNLARKKKR